jgi:hypothetical protein
LWVVLTAFFVPALALWAVNDNMKTWQRLDRITIEQCVNEETADRRTDALLCAHKRGADQTMFQHEHTTSGRYWGEALGFAFIADLMLTALVVGAFFVGRWVVRGFKGEA